MVWGVVLTVTEVVKGGRGEEKLKVGRAVLLMGSEMVGSSGTSATCCQKTSMDVTMSLISKEK